MPKKSNHVKLDWFEPFRFCPLKRKFFILTKKNYNEVWQIESDRVDTYTTTFMHSTCVMFWKHIVDNTIFFFLNYYMKNKKISLWNITAKQVLAPLNWISTTASTQNVDCSTSIDGPMASFVGNWPTTFIDDISNSKSKPI